MLLTLLLLILYLTVTGSVACFCLDESPYTKSANQARAPDGALSVRRQSIPGKTSLFFVTLNFFNNSKVILIKIQLVIKSKLITVTTKQL